MSRYEELTRAAANGADLDALLGQEPPAQRRFRPPDSRPGNPGRRISKAYSAALAARAERRERLAQRWTVEGIRVAVLADQAMKEWPTFTRHVVNLAQLLGWMTSHHRALQSARSGYSTGVMGDQGDTDLVLARQGKVRFVELKRNNTHLSGHQKLWRDELPKENYRLWKPRQIDAIIDDLR